MAGALRNFAGHLGKRYEDVQRLLPARRLITAKIIVPGKCVLALYQRVYWIGSLLHLY